MGDLVTLTMPISDVLLGWFAETTLVASALAAMAALAARVPRLAPSPAARHALWLMVMIKLVTPPLVHWPWSVPSPIATTRADSTRDETVPARTGDVGMVEPGRMESTVTPSLAGSPEVPAHEMAAKAATSALDDERVEAVDGGAFPAIPPLPRGLGAWIVLAWLAGSIAIGLGQAQRVSRFRRLLHEATSAPDWLVEEAELIGRHLSVRVPPILVVPRLGTPVLWCLGRPILLVPSKLVQTLEAGRWGAIIAHELAHLRRGDHWVRRLELAAGLAWWWNPVYWVARNRLDFEAELACDAWAVWASPRDRLSYAESLLQICTTLSPIGPPAPALGIIGTGRSFERRLTMILRDRVDRRVSAPGLLAASLLAALALPSWTLADGAAAGDEPVAVEAPAVPAPVVVPVTVARVVVADEPIDVEFTARVDDDDEKDEAASAEKKAAKLKAEKAAKDDSQKAAKLKAEKAALQKKMEALGKEMEAKFGEGSEFAKEIEKQFGPGSEFVKKMETFGKEMEKKFGEGSEFAEKMEALGKEMEKKFGPGSEFAKEMEKKFGEGSEFAKEMQAKFKDVTKGDDKVDAKKQVRIEIRAKADADRAKANAEKAMANAAKVQAEAEAEKSKTTTGLKEAEYDALRQKLRAEGRAKVEVRTKANGLRSSGWPSSPAITASERRARQIKALESRIESMMLDLKKLKAEADDEDGDKDEDGKR